MEGDEGVALRLDAWKDVRRISAGGPRGGRVVVVMRRAKVGAMECHFLMDGAFREEKLGENARKQLLGGREAKELSKT